MWLEEVIVSREGNEYLGDNIAFSLRRLSFSGTVCSKNRSLEDLMKGSKFGTALENRIFNWW